MFFILITEWRVEILITLSSYLVYSDKEKSHGLWVVIKKLKKKNYFKYLKQENVKTNCI